MEVWMAVDLLGVLGEMLSDAVRQIGELAVGHTPILL
jgi:hypothetical protein